MEDGPMLALVSDHMENGFLENIIDMFRHDQGLYALVPALMSDGRTRVRIGTVALFESLRGEHAKEMRSMLPAVAALLRHPEPHIRADAACLLGATGLGEAVPYLEEASEDPVEPVRMVIREVLEELA